MKLTDWLGKPYIKTKPYNRLFSGTGGYLYLLYRDQYWTDVQRLNEGWLSHHPPYTLKCFYLGVFVL